MFSLFKKSASAAEFATVIWEGCSEWPVKHGDALKDRFTFEKDINDVFDEMVYFLSFAADYAFYCQLEKKLSVEKAVRDAFAHSFVAICPRTSVQANSAWRMGGRNPDLDGNGRCTDRCRESIDES